MKKGPPGGGPGKDKDNDPNNTPETSLSSSRSAGEKRTPIFVVQFQAAPRIDPIRSLRGCLKVAKRLFGLRAIAIDVRQDEP